MKPVTDKYKKYFTVVGLLWAVCFVLLIFIYITLVTPQVKNKNQLQLKLRDTRKMYESAFKVSQQDYKQQIYEQVNRIEHQLGDYVISSSDVADLTFDISQLAAGKGINSFSIKNENGSGFTAIPQCELISESRYSVEFSGSFYQFATLLNALERHRPVIFIDKFEIGGLKQQGQSGYPVKMDLVVLVSKKQDGETKIDEL